MEKTCLYDKLYSKYVVGGQYFGSPSMLKRAVISPDKIFCKLRWVTFVDDGITASFRLSGYSRSRIDHRSLSSCVRASVN